MSFFTPDLCIDKVTEIDLALLKRQQIKGLILDVDNTLTVHGSQDVGQPILDWLKQMADHGIRLTIVSNNFEKRVRPFADRLGLHFVSFSCKPMTWGFTRACRTLGLPKQEIAVVGDQIYTDIMGGNLKGMYTILVNPFQMEKKLLFRLKRWLEKIHIKKYYRIHPQQ